MKILILHENSREVEKLKNLLTTGGYETYVAESTKDCPGDADMVLMCRDTALTIFPSPGNSDEIESFAIGDFSINFQSRTVISHEKKFHLTPIEFRIVTLLVKNQGKVLTHEQIINEIWGPFNSDSLLLRVNIANIRRKIEPNKNDPRYILTETGIGYYVATS